MRKFVVSVTAILGLFILFWASSPRQNIVSDRAPTLADYVPAAIEEAGIPGLALAIIQDKKIVHIAGYGLADVETERAMTPVTPINIASISKPILGISLLQLREQGLLDLDTDINTYLRFRIDNPYLEDEVITLRHLASHSSGIADFIDPDDWTHNVDPQVSLNAYIRGLLTPSGERYKGGAHYLEHEPGATREYSNLAAGVAGAVAESIGETSLENLTQRSIFGPLGMKNTSWLLRNFTQDELAVRYEVRQCIPYTGVCATSIEPVANYLISKVFRPAKGYKSFEAYPHYGNPNYPDGGLHASVSDLSKLTLWLLQRGEQSNLELLSDDSFSEMLSLQLPDDISTRQRFFWRDRYGLTGHAGSDRGIFSSLYFDIESGDAIIVLMNRTPDGDTEAAMESIIKRAKLEYFRK